MPTLYWLVGRPEREAVSRLESRGGVQAAERAVDREAIAASHARYSKERAALLAGGPRFEHDPSGGVGGARQGVKCLHSHLAWYLVGGEDPVGEWTAEQIGIERSSYSPAPGPAPVAAAGVGPVAAAGVGPVAAVDCGTNSTRLLVLDGEARRLDRRMQITRLGEAVDRTRELAPAAIERTLAVLASFRELLDRHGVDAGRVRAAATSAARDASNSEAFLGPAAEILGVRPEVIEGTEEGRLSYLGATASLDELGGPYLVVDVGGGSTELILGSEDGKAGPREVVSVDIGCVRATERFLRSDPPAGSELAAARAAVSEQVAKATGGDGAGWRAARRLVGLAGTVSAITVLALGLEAFDESRVHHATVSLRKIDEITARLASVPLAERREMRGVEPERADVLVGGAVVLAEVMRVCGFDELTASEADILDGIALRLLGRG